MDTKQGRCWTCKIRIVWTGAPLVRDAGCPRCGKRLARTTYDALVPCVTTEPPLRVPTYADRAPKCPHCGSWLHGSADCTVRRPLTMSSEVTR